MTDTIGPFDSTTWSEAQWYRYAGTWAPSGVFGSPPGAVGSGDLPFSQSGLTVGVAAGRAWVRGAGFERTGAAVMQAVAANTHASFNRRDRLVLRRNLATHTVSLVVVLGTAASSPTPPALTLSESGSWDLPLFSWLAPPASGTTLTSVIDERGWIDPGGRGPLTVPSIAIRDTHFPSPVQGDQCCVAGALHVHTGGGWSWRVFGFSNVTSDSGGNMVVAHGLGAVPTGAIPGRANQATDLLNRITDFGYTSSDATNISWNVRRDDTAAWIATTQVQFAWVAFV